MPPKDLRRQVAMAVMSRRRVRKALSSGRAAAGLGRESRRNSMKTESLSAASARAISSAGVAPWTAMHSLPTRRRGSSRGRRGQRIDRAGDRERHSLQLTHLKGVLLLNATRNVQFERVFRYQLCAGRGWAGDVRGVWHRRRGQDHGGRVPDPAFGSHGMRFDCGPNPSRRGDTGPASEEPGREA